MPSTVIDSGPQRTLSRYERAARRAAPAPRAGAARAAAGRARDLLRPAARAARSPSTSSLSGRRTYLLEYGEIEYADRGLGLEHWIEEVIPAAIRAASADAGAGRCA